MIKRLLFIGFVLISSISVNAQNRADIEKRISEMNKAYNEERYAGAINIGEPLAAAVDKLGTQYGDSVFILTGSVLSRSYNRIKQYSKAAEIVERVLDR